MTAQPTEQHRHTDSAIEPSLILQLHLADSSAPLVEGMSASRARRLFVQTQDETSWPNVVSAVLVTVDGEEVDRW